MIESTHLAVKFMSLVNGGRGGVIINVSSMGGELFYIMMFHSNIMSNM